MILYSRRAGGSTTSVLEPVLSDPQPYEPRQLFGKPPPKPTIGA